MNILKTWRVSKRSPRLIQDAGKTKTTKQQNKGRERGKETIILVTRDEIDTCLKSRILRGGRVCVCIECM